MTKVVYKNEDVYKLDDLMQINETHIWKPKLQILWNHPFLKPLSTDSYIIYTGSYAE